LVAATIALLAQPLYAEDDHKEGGTAKKGGGGKHAAAPAAKGGHAPKSAATKAPAPHFATQSPRQFNNKNKKSAPVAQARAGTIPGAAATQPRSFAQSQQRSAPNVAASGATYNNGNAPVTVQNSQTFAGNRSAGNFQPSVEVSRGWDRGNSHSWNHHNYRWNNGNWVIINTGGYGSPYDSQSLAASVQAQLAQQGYNPGPPDGVIGGQTRDAIASFQNDHRLPVTGQIDPPLLQAMGLN